MFLKFFMVKTYHNKVTIVVILKGGSYHPAFVSQVLAYSTQRKAPSFTRLDTVPRLPHFTPPVFTCRVVDGFFYLELYFKLNSDLCKDRSI